MDRHLMLQQLNSTTQWDIVIIGGGATGLGSALDAASRGYKTLLIEQYDFGKGTSSRSTKLVHGGVRYLAQGNIKLVKEALRERAYLLRNAPHVCHTQTFILPVFSWWQKWYYAIGLKLYDLLAGQLSLGATRVLSTAETRDHLPSLRAENLAGGILYYDGQFDDSRLCIDLAATAVAHGAIVLNYCRATGFRKNKKGKITELEFADTLDEQTFTVKTKVVINATGVFTDALMQLDDHTKHSIVSPSQGIHLVVDKKNFPGVDAMLIPKTDDGRVLFAVPWHDKVVLGTTDTPIDEVSEEPWALEEEIDFVIAHFNRYSHTAISRTDVRAVFAGLRPLVKTAGPKRTALLARDHTLIIAPSGLVTITGGKWTTYRKMAEDAVDNAVFVSKQEKRTCITKDLPISNREEKNQLLRSIKQERAGNEDQLHPDFPYTLADVLYGIRYEMAMDVEDILARRTRILFLDAQIALELCEIVTGMIAKELGKDDAWKKDQIANFQTVAQQYLVS
jgi:glycerol-3-phosphate dehydrogenase